VNVCPAIVRVPLRELVLGLAATEYVAVPLPEPVLAVVIQDALLEADQLQPALAETVTLPAPPLEVAGAVVG